MFVDKPDNEVPLKMLFGKFSGSCWYVNPVSVNGVPVKVKFSCNPCVPPPQDMLNGTPICLSFSVFNPLGIISSKFSIVKFNLPLTKTFNLPKRYFPSINHFSFSWIKSVSALTCSPLVYGG